MSFIKKNIKVLSYVYITLFFLSITKADTTPPTSSILANPSNPTTNNEWYNTYIKVDINSVDLQSGIKSIFYKINNNDWESKSFYNTLNLIDDPSFEDNTYSYWNTGFDNDASSINLDYQVYEQGFRSIKINSKNDNWAYVSNINNFVSAIPYTTYNVSASIKTNFIDDNNDNSEVYIKVYGVFLDENNNLYYEHISNSEKVIKSTTDFTKLFHTFTVNYPDIIGTYIEIGVKGTSEVWIDSVLLNKSIENPNITLYLNEQGTNTLQYYSVDNNNNYENIKTKTYKIDSIPPNNFTKPVITFDTNSNIVSVQTSVTDNLSGISNNSDKYQYKVSYNNEYGTYSDLLSCNSTWVNQNWNTLENFTINNNTAYITTPYINLCNTTTDGCKSIRFKIKDNAQNEITKEFCINGSWSKFNNSSKIYSRGGVDFMNNISDNDLNYIESGNSTLNYFSENNFKSAKNVNLVQNNFEYYLQKVNEVSDSNELNSNSISSIIKSDFVINDETLNISEGEVFNKVLFVEGDITIDSNININKDSILILVAKENVNINKDVSEIDAVIISDKEINTAYNLNNDEIINYNTQLTINGSLIGNNIKLSRRFSDNTNPAEVFNFEPKYIVKSTELFNNSKIEWTYIN